MDYDLAPALELHQQGRINEFIEHMTPLAKVLAASTARKYFGSQYATQLDEDSFMSTALDGLMQVANKPIDPPSVGALHRLSVMVMKRRMADLERYYLSGKGSHLNHIPDERIGDRADMKALDHSDAIASEEYLAYVKDKISKICTPAETRVLHAMIDYAGQYEQKDIAEMLEMQRDTFYSLLRNARKKMLLYSPELEEELKTHFGKSDSLGR